MYFLYFNSRSITTNILLRWLGTWITVKKLYSIFLPSVGFDTWILRFGDLNQTCSAILKFYMIVWRRVYNVQEEYLRVGI